MLSKQSTCYLPTSNRFQIISICLDRRNGHIKQRISQKTLYIRNYGLTGLLSGRGRGFHWCKLGKTITQFGNAKYDQNMITRNCNKLPITAMNAISFGCLKV